MGGGWAVLVAFGDAARAGAEKLLNAPPSTPITLDASR
jgi:hypothetical protein